MVTSLSDCCSSSLRINCWLCSLYLKHGWLKTRFWKCGPLVTFDQIAGRKMEVIRLERLSGLGNLRSSCCLSPPSTHARHHRSILSTLCLCPQVSSELSWLALLLQMNFIYHPRSLLVIRLKMYNFLSWISDLRIRGVKPVTNGNFNRWCSLGL